MDEQCRRLKHDTEWVRAASRTLGRTRVAVRSVFFGAGHALALALVTVGFYLLLDANARPAESFSTLLLASGLTALVWSYAGLLLGLLVGTRPTESVRTGAASARINRRLRSRCLTWHRQLNVAVLAITLLHALVFAILTPGGTLLVAFVPGAAPLQSLGYTVGVLALYLALILGPSYYFRDRIGRRLWLIAHQFAALSYALGLWHCFALGPDFRLEGTGRVLLWVLQIPLLAAFVLRLQRPLRPSDQLRQVRKRGQYDSRRQQRFRGAVVLGILSSAFIVLVVLLVAIGPGAHVG